MQILVISWKSTVFNWKCKHTLVLNFPPKQCVISWEWQAVFGYRQLGVKNTLLWEAWLPDLKRTFIFPKSSPLELPWGVINLKITIWRLHPDLWPQKAMHSFICKSCLTALRWRSYVPSLSPCSEVQPAGAPGCLRADLSTPSSVKLPPNVRDVARKSPPV